jgi:hypothetical protein
MLEVVVDRGAAAERGRRLEYFTIIWNSLEGCVGVFAGMMAGSISLVGFGVDSFIEVTSGAALLWRMSGDADERTRAHRERRTLRIVGACFLVLAVYVGVEAISDLVERQAPAHSLPGIVLAGVSLMVMPVLSRAKRRVGAALGSAAMHADARQTEFAQSGLGPMVGRPSGRTGDGPDYRQRGDRRPPRRSMLPFIAVPSSLDVSIISIIIEIWNYEIPRSGAARMTW